MAELIRRFKLKPVVIEAFRFGVDPEPWWWREQVAKGAKVTQVLGRDGQPLAAQIETIATLKNVYPGDWVLRDSNGELSCLKHDAFKAQYDQEEAR